MMQKIVKTRTKNSATPSLFCKCFCNKMFVANTTESNTSMVSQQSCCCIASYTTSILLHFATCTLGEIWRLFVSQSNGEGGGWCFQFIYRRMRSNPQYGKTSWSVGGFSSRHPSPLARNACPFWTHAPHYIFLPYLTWVTRFLFNTDPVFSLISLRRF